MSILLAVVFVAISSSMAIYALCKGKTPELRLFPDFGQVSVFDLFTAVPVFVTGFGFHVNGKRAKEELLISLSAFFFPLLWYMRIAMN